MPFLLPHQSTPRYAADVKYVRTAIVNQHALYRSKGSTKVKFAQRQVSVPSREESPTSDSSVGATLKLSRQINSSRPCLGEIIGHLTSTDEMLTAVVQQSIGRQQDPLSYAVKREQFLEE
jgi:hypothetical protein